MVGQLVTGRLSDAYGRSLFVFYVGGAFAVTGVCTFLAVLAHDHGRAALTAW